MSPGAKQQGALLVLLGRAQSLRVSCPAKAGHPVTPVLSAKLRSAQAERPVAPGSPACAGDDEREAKGLAIGRRRSNPAGPAEAPGFGMTAHRWRKMRWIVRRA